MTVYSTKRIMKESMPLLTVCVAVGIAGGQVLSQNQQVLISFPIFLVMFPVINALGGNIGSIMGARLSSGLHMGTISTKSFGKALQENISRTLLLGIISYTFLTIFILLISPLLGIFIDSDILLKTGYIMIATGLILTFIVILVAIVVARFSYENGFDPDNTVTPIVTTLCDILGIIILTTMIGAVGI
ncbi:MAG: magnesium transporter [Thermoplasmata archaeon]|nr:MAG: magnesium transporter [Thermoplasmata archaeon]